MYLIVILLLSRVLNYRIYNVADRMSTVESKMRIMIVEDDPLIRQLYEQILMNKGYQVIAVASDGDEAISTFRSLDEKPDIIILDFRLPSKNGLEVSNEILAENNRTEILMISGDPTFDRKAIIGRGINFIQKPVQINQILREISVLSG